MKNKKYDVYGIGTPFIDILVNANDEHIDKFNFKKGSTHIVDGKKADYILNCLKGNDIRNDIKIASGGDCSNTLIGIASLGGKVVFNGNIGNDNHGRLFEDELIREGVLCNLNKKNGFSNKCIVMITPDSERTMATLFGECMDEDFKINEKHIAQSKYLYVTGHMFDNIYQKKAALQAMKIAKRNNVRIAFDLADPLAVKNNKNLFIKIVKNYVNVLFANEEEAEIFTNESDYMKSLKKISGMVDVAIVKIGSRGSVVKFRNKIIKIKPYYAEAIDTTGAGDMYAAGFLYGLSQRFSLERSGKIASFLSSRVVEQIGARLNIPLNGMISGL